MRTSQDLQPLSIPACQWYLRQLYEQGREKEALKVAQWLVVEAASMSRHDLRFASSEVGRCVEIVAHYSSAPCPDRFHIFDALLAIKDARLGEARESLAKITAPSKKPQGPSSDRPAEDNRSVLRNRVLYLCVRARLAEAGGETDTEVVRLKEALNVARRNDDRALTAFVLGRCIEASGRRGDRAVAHAAGLMRNAVLRGLPPAEDWIFARHLWGDVA